MLTASSASTSLSSSRNGVAAYLKESRVLFAAVRISFDTLNHELFHIVDHLSNLLAISRNLFNDVVTTQTFAWRRWFVGFNRCSDEFPSLAHVFTGTRHFEVVNINHEQHFQFTMPVHAAPIRNRGETPSNQSFLALGFPVSSGVWVPAKCQFQQHDWFAESTSPLGWPSVLRNSGPCFDASKAKLYICLFGVAL